MHFYATPLHPNPIWLPYQQKENLPVNPGLDSHVIHSIQNRSQNSIPVEWNCMSTTSNFPINCLTSTEFHSLMTNRRPLSELWPRAPPSPHSQNVTIPFCGSPNVNYQFVRISTEETTQNLQAKEKWLDYLATGFQYYSTTCDLWSNITSCLQRVEVLLIKFHEQCQ